MQIAARTLIGFAVLLGCERAEPPAAPPPVPEVVPEQITPKVIVEHRSHVEHPPAEPPGAGWFRRLTRTERAGVDWVCRNERRDPCWGPVGLRAFTPEETARYDKVAGLVGKSMERHCTQVYGPRRGCNTPLVVSFDGGPVTFDHDIRPFSFFGEPVATAWPTAATPWLARDTNGDGTIDHGDELFRGFATLAALDDNHDGVIDAHDAAFASLVLWADANADRRSTPDELTPLASVVTSIPLANHLDVRCDDGDCEGQRGTAMLRDGSTAAVIDVYLKQR